MEHIFLLPGQYHISKKPELIETLVGSCVSVCLYNTKTPHAAMNHFLLDKPATKTNPDIGRYGSTATEHIIKALMKFDPNPKNYRAEIFGGAAVIKTSSDENIIGQKNIDIARRILNNHQIRIIKEDTAGKKGRRIKFNTETKTTLTRLAGQIKKI